MKAESVSLSLSSFPSEPLRALSSNVEPGRPPLEVCLGCYPRGVLSCLGVKPVFSGLGVVD